MRQDELLLFGWDGLQLLVPTTDVSAIGLTNQLQPLSQNETEQLPEQVIGLFAQQQSRWPVYAFDYQLQPRTVASAQPLFVVLFASPVNIGLVCEQADTLPASTASQLHYFSVPPVMATENSPITALAVLDQQQFFCVTNAAAWENFLIGGVNGSC